MSSRNTYWLASLSLLLSLSLALPYCCHADISKVFSDHKEMSTHASHGQTEDMPQCECGHELVKDYQKTKKVTTGFNTSSLSGGILSTGTAAHVENHSGELRPLQPPELGDNTGPPIHLLNSVFLN